MKNEIKYHAVAVMSRGQLTACIIYLGDVIYYVTTDVHQMASERKRILNWKEIEQFAGTW